MLTLVFAPSSSCLKLLHFRCRHRFPELPLIDRCHSYAIRTKYSYRCANGCPFSVNRHSKSLDTARFVCPRCHGRLELFLNKLAGAASATPGRRVLSTPATPAASAAGNRYFSCFRIGIAQIFRYIIST